MLMPQYHGQPEHAAEQTVTLPVIWDATVFMSHHGNDSAKREAYCLLKPAVRVVQGDCEIVKGLIHTVPK